MKRKNLTIMLVAGAIIFVLSLSILGVRHWLSSPGVHKLGKETYINLQEVCYIYNPLTESFLENGTLTWNQKLLLSQERSINGKSYFSVSSAPSNDSCAVFVDGLDTISNLKSGEFTQFIGGLYFPDGKLDRESPLAELLVITQCRDWSETWILFALPENEWLILGFPGDSPRIVLCGFESRDQARDFLDDPYGKYLLDRIGP